MPTIIRDPSEMQRVALGHRGEGKRVAVVPTMGALHAGHVALIRRAREAGDIVIVTIFVNPTQFAPTEDLSRYPRPFDEDVRNAGQAGADVVFAPANEAMYPEGYATFVTVEGVTRVLEGASRPTHFRGVTTIVAKLFNITLPHVAVFGQKDGQQVVVVRKMVADMNIPVELIVVPTVREADGLAMSSRNVYLSKEQRAEAPALFQALSQAKLRIESGVRSASAVIEEIRNSITVRSSGLIDYVSLADSSSLAEVDAVLPGKPVMISLAVRFGATRLIDNIIVEP
jgi:pantoate--beta-alanine ligase